MPNNSKNMSGDYANMGTAYFAENTKETYDFTNLYFSEIFQMLITIRKNHEKLSIKISPEKKLERKYVIPLSPEKRLKKREFPIYIKRTDMPLKETGSIDFNKLRKIIFNTSEAFIIYYHYQKNFEGEEGKIPFFIPEAEFDQEKQKYNFKKRVYVQEILDFDEPSKILEKLLPYWWPHDRYLNLYQILNNLTISLKRGSDCKGL